MLCAELLSPAQTCAQLRAELESTFGSPTPTNISGTSFIYDPKTDTFVVRENARLRRGPTLLTGKELRYERKSQKASAFGDVRLVNPELKIRASSASLDLDSETGELKNAVIAPRTGSYTIAGRIIDKLSGARFHIEDGFFTTCGCEKGTPSWSISGKEINCHIGGQAEVKDATFHVLGYPLLTLPYATFPANSQRQSGFISPYTGESTLRGFQWLQPYFIDLGKSEDVTIASDVETSQRLGLLAEFRRQSSADDYIQVTGSIYQEIIPEAERLAPEADLQVANPYIPTQRYGLIGLGRQHLTPNLQVYGDTQLVSDDYFLRDINVPVLSPGYGFNFMYNRQAISHFGLLNNWDNSFLRFQGTWEQDLIQPQQFALQQLPQLLYEGRSDVLNGLGYVDYTTSAVEYWREQGTNGQRLDFKPTFTLPLLWKDYLNAHASVTLRSTAYNYGGDNVDVIPVGTDGRQYNNGLVLGQPAPGGDYFRELPYGEVGTSTVLERIYTVDFAGIEKIKHTIEPIVTYYYVPNVNQSNLPLWDAIDRIDPRSMFSVGLASRVFAKYKAPPPSSSSSASQEVSEGQTTAAPPATRVQELLEFNITQIYDTLYPLEGVGRHYSDTDITLNLLPTNIVIASSETGIDPGTGRIDYSFDYLTLRPPETWYQYQSRLGKAAIGGTFLQLGYNYVAPTTSASTNKALTLENETNQITANIYYETSRWGFYIGPGYDLATSNLLSAEYGGRIKSTCNCWILDFGVVQSVNPLEYRFQIMLTLGGIGSVGSSPIPNNPFAIYNPRLFAQPPPPPLPGSTQQ